MSIKDRDREALAWAAGFFDGEGNVLYIPVQPGRRRARIRIQIGQSGSPELLERFRDAVGCGNVIGPYYKEKPGGGLAKAMYRLSMSSFEDAQHVMCCIWPWLGTEKRSQFTTAVLSARSDNASYVDRSQRGLAGVV